MAGAILQMLLASAGAGLAAGQGSFSATEGADASAFTGILLVQGGLAATEGADLGAFESPLIVEGTIAATEGADTAAMAGTVFSPVTERQIAIGGAFEAALVSLSAQRQYPVAPAVMVAEE